MKKRSQHDGDFFHIKSIRKVLSLVLSATLILGCIPMNWLTELGLPMQAHAAEIPVDQSSLSTEQPKTFSTGTYTLKDISITGGNGQSAVVINGDVTLNIEGTVVLTGGDAYFKETPVVIKDSSGNTLENTTQYTPVGAGAGIEVPAGSKLTLTGSGTLIAKGGNGASGLEGMTVDEYSDACFMPVWNLKGRGGGGAGAGIGSRGADTADSTPAAGNININDKGLLVQATGGAGGSSGGKGGNGMRALIYKHVFHNGYVAGSHDLTIQGGFGGQGGGGAGYPAAGIGSGGAAGGNGGAGGQGGRDSASIYLTVVLQFVVGDTDEVCVSGGGGGGGGQGYRNGGGGGGGGGDVYEIGAKWNSLDTYGTVEYGYDSNGSKGSVGLGGESGCDASEAKYPSASIHSGKLSCGSGTGGYASGIAGNKGSTKGGDGDGASKDGEKGSTAGNKASGGVTTLQGGTVYAVSGGGSAQDIGSGDGNGTATGSLIIRGGALAAENDRMPVPTNGTAQVYPVSLRPMSYTDSAAARTDITINGYDWFATRFLPNRTDGLVTVWLPDGKYTAQVAGDSTDGLPVCPYNEFTVSGSGIEPKPDLSAVRIDLNQGELSITASSYNQGGATHAYSGKAILYNSTSGKGKVTLQNNAGNNTLTLQNANIELLTVGENSQLTLVSEGTGNHIDTLEGYNQNSGVTFEGDATSNLSIGAFDARGRQNTVLNRTNFEYISEVALGVGDSADAAKKQLTDNGFYVLNWNNHIDLNKDARGKYIYIGIKKTWDPNEAIRNLYCYNTKQDVMENGNIKANAYKKSYLVPCYGGNGDLNQGAGGDDIFLYYSKEKYDKNGVYAKPISYIKIYLNQNASYNATYYDEWLLGYNGSKQDLNEEAGGAYIYIAISRYSPDKPIFTLDSYNYRPGNPYVPSDLTESGKSQQHAGSITMNSRGTVQIGSIQSNKRLNRSANEQGNGYPSSDMWGTPSVTVNSGRLVFDTFIDWSESRIFRNSIPYPIYMPILYPSGNENGEFWMGNNISQQNTDSGYVGNNVMGDVTVNGGTLQIGANGEGALPKASDGGTGVTGMNVKVKAGGNLLSGSAAGSGIKLTITGLPKNTHLSLIPRSDNANCVGNYANQDIWTNDNGNFITYVTTSDNGKNIVFVDPDGNAYHYQLTVSGSSASAVRVTPLSAYSGEASTAPLRIHPKYMVLAGTLYGHTEGTEVPLSNDLGGILLEDQVNAAVTTSNMISVGYVTGNGTLKISGSGMTVTGEFNVAETTIESGAVTAPAIGGSVRILGGSVKTDQPLTNAQNNSGAVYLAKIPGYENSVTVDGNTYTVGGSHGDDYMYLYLPRSSKLVQAGERWYVLSFDESSLTFSVRERKNGDGHIDLSDGSAEILDDEQYIYKGELYLNENGNKYSVTGTSIENTLTVSGGKPDITITDLNLSGKPIDIQSGINAKITLSGSNTLSGSPDTPAIHVAEGAALTLNGVGQLHAAGGTNAPAIGGASGEANGKIVINSGTFELTGTYHAAIGAGSGAETPGRSIVINGGTIHAVNSAGGELFGTTPVNSNGEALACLVFTPQSVDTVLVDGADFGISQANNDDRLYLYLVSSRHTVRTGGNDYLVVPLSVGSTENGTISLRYMDPDGSERLLSNGDMVVEDAKVRISTLPDAGYGIQSGPAGGIYRVMEENDSLLLYPLSGYSSIVLDTWTADTANAGFEKNIIGTETIQMGTSGTAGGIVTFTASGAGLTAEILVDGVCVKSAELSNTAQTVSCTIDRKDVSVELRFTGNGTARLSSALLSETADISRVNAVFARTITLNLVQTEKVDGEFSGVIYAYGRDGTILKDRNPVATGIQIFAGEEVSIEYIDPDGGTIFECLNIVHEDSSTETISETSFQCTANDNMTVSASTREIKRYPVTLTDDDNGITEFRYKVGDASEWSSYTEPFTVHEGESLTIEAILTHNYLFEQWANDITSNPYTIDHVDGAVNFSPTSVVMPQETTPSVVIDFEAEKLTGFLTGTYKINGNVVYPDAGGELAIDRTWFGTTLSIIRTGNGTSTLDSEAQSLVIPARPVLTGVSKTDCTTVEDNDGILSGVTSAMEYRRASEELWTTGTGEDIIGIAGGTTYFVRIKAIAGSVFRSAEQAFTIAKCTNAPTYTVTIPATVELGETVSITAGGVSIVKDSQLVVTLSGTSDTDNAFKLATEKGADLNYTITRALQETGGISISGGSVSASGSDTSVSVGDTVLTVAGGISNNSGSAVLTFSAPTTSIRYSGKYKGTVTFTVAIQNGGGS